MNYRRYYIAIAVGLIGLPAVKAFALAVPAVSSTSARSAPLVSSPTAPAASTGLPAGPSALSATPLGLPALGGLLLSTGTSSAPAVEPSTSSAPSPVIIEEYHPSRFARIVKIRVEGNRNIRDRVILAEAKTKKNDLYNAEALRKDVQAIYALGDFDDVNVDVADVPGGVAVTFRVAEKPLIKRVDFKGNKKLSTSKLRDAITLKEGDALDKLKLNMDVDKLITTYKDEGFAAAQAEPFTTSDPTNHVIVTFYVTEGTQVLVEAAVLDGVKAFPVKKILKLMKTRRKKVFKQEVLAKDLEDINKFYKNNGYQNVKIGDAQQTFNADKTRLTLRIAIDEGPLLHFGETRFAGNLIFPSEKLIPSLQYKTGDIFNQDKLDASVSKLQDQYGALGYIRVQVKPEFAQDLPRQAVATTYNINEGQVVYVDHIAVEGNTHTKEYVIRREIRLKEGDPFSSVKARKSVERLYNLGFLDNVDVDVQQPESPSKADVIFTVTEGKPGVLSAGAGFSSVDGLIGTAQLQNINFLGRGQRLNLQAQFGGRINSFDLGWTEPWFLGKPMTFGVDIFNVVRINQLGTTRNAYNTEDRGIGLTAGPRFQDELYSLLFSYRYASDRRYNVCDPTLGQCAPSIPPLVLGPNAPANGRGELTVYTSNLTEQLIRDTRDNQFDPTRGTRGSLALTEGGLAPNAIKFYKTAIDESVHIPTFWKFVLSLHGQWGYVKPYGDSTLTDIVDELFRVGGSETVRGYDIAHVGVITGGQVESVYNVEYKFPIAPDEHGRTLLQGVFFYDIGGSWNNLGDINYQINGSQAGLKQGVGFGIRFKTPVFPLRLDYGIPLNQGPNDAPSQFYFTIGSLF